MSKPFIVKKSTMCKGRSVSCGPWVVTVTWLSAPGRSFLGGFEVGRCLRSNSPVLALPLRAAVPAAARQLRRACAGRRVSFPPAAASLSRCRPGLGGVGNGRSSARARYRGDGVAGVARLRLAGCCLAPLNHAVSLQRLLPALEKAKIGTSLVLKTAK